MDFLIAAGPHPLPTEVKAAASGTLKGLRLFLDSHPRCPRGVRLHGGTATEEGKLAHLPLYCAGGLWGMGA